MNLLPHAKNEERHERRKKNITRTAHHDANACVASGVHVSGLIFYAPAGISVYERLQMMQTVVLRDVLGIPFRPNAFV